MRARRLPILGSRGRQSKRADGEQGRDNERCMPGRQASPFSVCGRYRAGPMLPVLPPSGQGRVTTPGRDVARLAAPVGAGDRRMCGIGVILNLDSKPVGALGPGLALMNRLLAHRGPDGEGLWVHDRKHVGFAHRRLEIIDLQTGQQPMHDGEGNWITYNVEIYNYVELRRELGEDSFQTTSDTEVVLRAYRRWGPACVERLRGMFAFALWDEAEEQLFCARDRFGIKPFAYALRDGVFHGASEAKAVLPFLPAIETDTDALKDYLAFQFSLAGKTLFKGVRELLPGHTLTVRKGVVHERKYWEVEYEPDFDHREAWLTQRLRELVEESVDFHLRADVPV